MTIAETIKRGGRGLKRGKPVKKIIQSLSDFLKGKQSCRQEKIMEDIIAGRSEIGKKKKDCRKEGVDSVSLCCYSALPVVFTKSLITFPFVETKTKPHQTVLTQKLYPACCQFHEVTHNLYWAVLSGGALLLN